MKNEGLFKKYDYQWQKTLKRFKERYEISRLDYYEFHEVLIKCAMILHRDVSSKEYQILDNKMKKYVDDFAAYINKCEDYRIWLVKGVRLDII